MATAEATTTGSYVSEFIQNLDLGGNPFNTGYQGDYFFAGAMRQNILDQLIHFCRFSDQLVVLTGPYGSGKTILVDVAVAKLYSVIDCCRITAQLLATPESILSELSRQLRFLIDEPISINDFLDRLSIGSEADPILVIVEQAHELEQEGIDLLVDLQRESDGMVHLVLTGEEALQHTVELAGVEEGELKTFKLPSLGEEEVGGYVQGRLQSAGYAGEQPLSKDKLAVLYEQSQGNFIRINELVPRLLAVDDKTVSRFSWPVKVPTAHILAIGVLGGALLLSYLYQGSPSPSFSEAPPSVDVQRSSITANDAAVKEEGVVGVVESVEAAVIEEAPLPAKKRFVPVIESTSTSLVAATISNEAAMSVEDHVREEGLIRMAAEPTSAPQAKSVPPTTKSVIEKPAVEALPVKAVTDLPPREIRLLGLPEANYMLQVLGSRSEQSARDFVKQYIDKLPITYFESQLGNKPWYVALTGPYADKPAATAAIKQLPAALQRQKPWAKSITSIQAAIRSHRGI
jgi:DamX protein